LISLVIPVYNEDSSIGEVIEDFIKCPLISEIIVVDDGSTDSTQEVLMKYPVTIIRHERNKGYLEAIKSGCKVASGDYIMLVDGDGQYKCSADFIAMRGDYLLSGAKIKRADPFLRIFLSRIMNLIVRLLFRLKLKDSNCGYKLFPRSLVPVLMETKMLRNIPLTEFCIRASRVGFDIREVSIPHFPRKHGKSRIFRKLAKSAIESLAGLLVLWAKGTYDLLSGAIVSRARNLLNRNFSLVETFYVGGHRHGRFPVSVDVRFIEEGKYIHPLILDGYVEVIHANLGVIRPLIIHCEYGRGRSVLVACAYLMKYRSLSWLEAFHKVKYLHSIAYLTPEQFKALRDYQKYLEDKRE